MGGADTMVKVRWVQRKTLTLEQANQMLPKVFHVPVLQAYDESTGQWVDVPQAQEGDDERVD